MGFIAQCLVGAIVGALVGLVVVEVRSNWKETPELSQPVMMHTVYYGSCNMAEHAIYNSDGQYSPTNVSI